MLDIQKYETCTDAEKFRCCKQEMHRLCMKNDWGDPHGYARNKEIEAAIVLEHRIATTYSGADAFNQNNDEVEYKSTTDEHCKGSYTGVSVQKTWEEQVEYLKNKKILKYKEHYYNRFESGIMVEGWKMSGEDVHRILLPKFKKSWNTRFQRKDPRLSANITWTEIQKHGTKVI